MACTNENDVRRDFCLVVENLKDCNLNCWSKHFGELLREEEGRRERKAKEKMERWN